MAKISADSSIPGVKQKDNKNQILAGIILLGHDVEDDGCQQDQALNDLLEVLVNTHNGHAQVDNAHQNCTDDNAGNGTDTAVSGSATSVLQGLGFTSIIMVSGIAGNLLNILLDWVFIFGKLGFPALGIEGAAIATVISNFLSAPLTILYVLRSLPAQLRSYRRVLALGIPSGLEYGLWNVGNFMLVSYLNRLDMMSAGIYTLVFSIETVPLMIYMGFANAGLTLVGQETGANDPKRAKQAGFLCLAISLVICLVIGIVFRLFPRQILSLFTDDISILDISVPYLVFIVWILFPKAINNVIGLCIRGMGDTRWMLYTQIFGTFFMITAGYILILRTGLGLSGIFVTLLADETIRGIANLIRFQFGGKSSFSRTT